MPVYFANVPRGPIGKFKRCLHECLPKWAVLSISFIGASITEILCHKAHVARLIATMRLCRYKPLPEYDPTLATPRDATPETARSYKAACLRRWIKLAAASPSPVCKDWYTRASEALLADDEGLDAVQPPKRKTTISGQDDSNESTDDTTSNEQPGNNATSTKTKNDQDQDPDNGGSNEQNAPQPTGDNDSNKDEDGLGSDDDIVELTPDPADVCATAVATEN